MVPHPMSTTKYAFRIRTRQGLVVENLMIHGRDEADAQRENDERPEMESHGRRLIYYNLLATAVPVYRYMLLL